MKTQPLNNSAVYQIVRPSASMHNLELCYQSTSSYENKYISIRSITQSGVELILIYKWTLVYYNCIYQYIYYIGCSIYVYKKTSVYKVVYNHLVVYLFTCRKFYNCIGDCNIDFNDVFIYNICTLAKLGILSSVFHLTIAYNVNSNNVKK